MRQPISVQWSHVAPGFQLTRPFVWRENRAEGFVVCDAKFRRVKIKSPQYVAIAGLTTHDKNMTNKRRMLQVRLASPSLSALALAFP